MARTRQVMQNGKLVDVDTIPAAAPATDDGDASKLDLRGDGSIRRSAGGGRSFHEFFSTEHRNKPLARGELLGFIEWLAWSDRQSRWYRRLWRWLNRTPGPKGRGPMTHFADAYEERQLKPTVTNVQRALVRRAAAGQVTPSDGK